MTDDYKTISDRKEKHISNCLENNISFEKKTTHFEKYEFIHQALPELDLNKIDLSLVVQNKKLSAPIIIAPMVGGTNTGKEINLILSNCAQKIGLGFSVGSQRITRDFKESIETFRVRKAAPDILLFANLGLVQLNYGFSIEDCRNIVKDIGADILTLHLNPLQECIQYGGNVNFEGLQEKLKKLCQEVDFPVIVKEVGHGISEDAAGKLIKAGIFGIDTAGAGGTSWSKVESHITEDELRRKIGDSFSEWGIPTAISIQYVRKVSTDIFLIASGGIRSGIDIAKVIALGADIVSIGLPLLKLAVQGQQKVMDYLLRLKEELRLTMFLTGCKNISELKYNKNLIKLPFD